jgi:hypothetical protein
MDLIFLNSDFSLATAPIDTYASAVFTSKYFTAGDFSVTVGKNLYAYIKDAAYVYNTETALTGVIENIECSDVVKVDGKLLEAILEKRTINDIANISGQLETSIRAMVTKYAITGARAIPTLILGTAAGFTTAIKAQPTQGSSLADAIRAIITPYGISYKCTYDYINGGIKFTLYQGKDRTQDQSVNSWAIFSADFENLLSYTYRKSTGDYKNYAYVYANDTVHGVLNLEIDQIAVGDARREMFYRSSISSTDDASNTMSLADWTAAVTADGTAELLKRAAVENVEGEAVDSGNMLYRTNYNLGDLCDIILSEIGIVWTARVSEIDEVYENGSRKVVPRFGESALTLREFIKREMK